MSNDRGISFGKKPVEAATAEFANNRAYVIGINAYQNGIPQLRTAVADAERLGKLLKESHGYTVLTLPRNGAPTLTTLRDLLHEKMPQEVGPDDRVLVYFAGHGIALDGEDGPEGYLVPEDANREDRASFLPMTELSDALAQLPCRHMLLILDCCFAGAFRWSSTRDLSALPSVIHRERYERYIQDPAWQVLTSAAYDQTALDVLSGNTIGERIETADHSPFAAALFRALAGDADLIPRGKDGQPGGDGVITATELYLYLRECVETATVEQRTRQTPGLWPLKKHDKGEYILLSPGHELNLPPAPELNYANNPYRGLQSFEEEHSQLFFGRTREIEELSTLVSSQALTVVLGASGTGKSSVVKAGLLPRLRSIDGENWQILPTIRPGKSPLATLASLTLPGETTGTDEASRLAQLWSDENAFAQRIQKWAESQPSDSRLLLTVDQFEELVTLCWDSWERDRFIGLLASALNAQPDRFRLVVTIRSDFEPQFSECVLQSRWMPSRYVVPAMSTDDLRAAIEGPASVRVLYFQPAELVDRLIDEVIQTPGAMPLLSFTLSELYVRYLERRGDDRCLTLADFEQLGGVAGSLRSRATELYDNFDGPHQATMQRIMLRMVSAQGGEMARRRVPKSELEYPSDNENDRVAAILNRLSEARLVVEGKEVNGDPYVEPAHDALVRGWEKLLAWTRGEQEQFSLRRLLTPAANDWHAHQGGTWHANPRLSLLNRIRRSEESWLNQTETRFISRSVTKRRTILAGASAFVIVAFIALSTVTYYAVGQRNEAVARAADLEKVAKFEEDQLSAIDVPLMASRLRADLIERTQMTLARRSDLTDEKRAVQLTNFEDSLAGLDFVGLSLATLDENVFEGAIQAIDVGFKEQPLVRARLLQTLANTLSKLGLLARATAPQTEALRIRREELGDANHLTLVSVGQMGMLLKAQSKLVEAEPYMREALEGFRLVHGDDDGNTVASINNMGFLREAQGRLTDAESYYREALDGRRRVLGDDHVDTLTSLNNMGQVLRAQDKLADSEVFQREALGGFRRVLGDDDQRTMTPVNNMGILLWQQGKLAEAETYLGEALEFNRRVLGDDHPNTLMSTSNMGLLLMNQNKLAEAESCYRDAVNGFRRVLGPDHLDTLTAISNMGTLLKRQDKRAEAEQYLREAMEANRRVLGDSHPKTLLSINNMGFLFEEQPAKAEPFLREALEGFRRVYGNDHQTTLGCMHSLGFILESQGKLVEAEPFFREALKGRRNVLGDEHQDTLTSIIFLGRLLDDLGNLDEAEKYKRETLETHRRVLGDDHRDTLTSMNELGSLLQKQGKHAEAETLRRDSVALARRAEPEGGGRLGYTLVQLGMSLLDRGKHADAEPLLRESLMVRERILPPQHWLVPNTRSVLGEALAGQGKFDEAESLLVESAVWMLTDPAMPTPEQLGIDRAAEAAERVVKLYEAWNTAEPDKGYDSKAAQWKKKHADRTRPEPVNSD